MPKRYYALVRSRICFGGRFHHLTPSPFSRIVTTHSLSLGNEAFAAKEFPKAVQYYTQAIQKEPRNHVFFSNRSASYAGLEQWDKAAEDAKECIRLDPSFVKGYYRLATAQSELQEHDAALATIRQGLAVDANNPQLTKQMRIVQQNKKLAQARKSQAVNHPNAAAGGQQLDEATARELQELQQQYAQTHRALQTAQASAQKTERETRLAELTRRELQNDVPETARCYRSIGKMFLQTSQPALIEHLDGRLAEQSKAQQDNTSRTEYLERQLQSQRQNIEELVGNAGGGGMVTS